MSIACLTRLLDQQQLFFVFATLLLIREPVGNVLIDCALEQHRFLHTSVSDLL
jgi:hypothetical protein